MRGLVLGAVGIELHPGRDEERADGQRRVEPAGDPDDHHVIDRPRRQRLGVASRASAGPIPVTSEPTDQSPTEPEWENTASSGVSFSAPNARRP